MEIRIDIQLPFKVSPEELSWAERMVPALALAMLELRRAGGQGREQELIALFAADVVPTLHDVRRAVRQAELVRAKARRAASSESKRVRRMMDKGDLLEEAMFIKRLGWSSSRLAKAVAAHRVFFVNHDGKRLYPAFYGDPAYDRRQLYSVTRTLGDLPGQAKLQFFSSPRGSLSKQTPLQALHAGKLASVKAAAEAFAAL
ncbi:hypothetical protein ACPWT1_03935 [Ramlibacter sp. MMS24-I3-19]|uniref:hypothetical protein n=1 Tax=Ramlibacter sp. MMS24-I3-19 TaxID=3416606 RepID=UPI003D07F8C5